MIDFKVKPDGGEPYDVTAGTRDVLVWEKLNKGKSFSSLRDAAMGDLYHLAFLASKREGLFSGTQKEFEESVELDFEDTGEPDPTQSGA